MKILNKEISSKLVLNVLLGMAIFGMFFILLSVNRMNKILSADLGFDKDSVYSIKTAKSSFVLPDSLIFSSAIPGFKPKHLVNVRSEFNPMGTKIDIQYVSDQYFDFFNYQKINEKASLFLDHDDGLLVYLNVSAVDYIGIGSVDDAPGTILIDEKNSKLIVCGVVEDYENLNLYNNSQPKIFQLTSDHLAYAFFSDIEQQIWLKEHKADIGNSKIVSFQERLKHEHMIWEDVVYSAFLFINIFILLICLGHIGIKYARKKEIELFKILGVGIHVLTLKK